MMILGAVMLTNLSAEAATGGKVVKITAKHKQSSDHCKEKVTLYGKAKDGTVVWKFTSPYVELTELDSNVYFENGNVVYLFSDKLYAINKSTGKVKWRYSKTVGSPIVCFDKSGNIYYTGFYDNGIQCLTRKGKLKFETKFPERYYWPSKITISNGKIKVYMGMDSEEDDDSNFPDENHYLCYDKNGKYLGLDK
jgi:outer membrane protein assembly factor BamB